LNYKFKTLHNKYLRGITWNHSRGYVPMIATAQRFGELNPGTDIQWHKRTLQEFADKPIDRLAEEFDLLVIDHPWTGFAAENHLFVPLDNELPATFLKDLQKNSIGPSFKSYQHNGQLWALPIDAATPVASYRADLFKKKKLKVPGNFKELLALAGKGYVILPAIPIDTLMNFFMFCHSLKGKLFATGNEVIDEKTGIRALDLFKSLTDKIPQECFHYNPINVYETLTATDEFLYCPFAYGYSNYARKGYSKNNLVFSDLIGIDSKHTLRSTIGGTGIAISQKSRHKQIALEYAQYVASAGCQQTLYFETGGQPAHLSAWTNKKINKATDGFFNATLPTLTKSYLRPRYNGYMYFQDSAGDVVRDYLMQGGDAKQVLEKLNQLFCESKINQQ